MRRLILTAGLSALLIAAMAMPASAALNARQQRQFTFQLNFSGAAVSLLPAGGLKESLKAQWSNTCNALVAQGLIYDYVAPIGIITTDDCVFDLRFP